MIQPKQAFRGGFQFRNFLGQPDNRIQLQALPPYVLIPLRQGFGTEVIPLVKVKEPVKAGQIIGRDDANISSPVHSSINGVVEDIRRINYFKRDVLMVFIRTTDSRETPEPLEGASEDWKKLSQGELESILYRSGVTAQDKEGIPTAFKSSIISPGDVETLIVHGVESEPYNISPDILMEGKKTFHLIEGIRILKKVMPKASVFLALNAHKKTLIEEVEKITSTEDWLKICPFEPKYPAGYDEMLVPTLLGRKFPYGYSAANIGIVILSLQAALGAYHAVAEGMPLIERTLALCGPGFKENTHLKARIGTPLSEILKGRLKDGPFRIVLNSLLTGVALSDYSLPIDKTFSQLIAIRENSEREFLGFLRPGRGRYSYSRTFLSGLMPKGVRYCDTNQHGEERPCIACGFCEELCPVNIIPHLLFKFVNKNIIDETLMKYRIFNCIECNLCSFVCPSKLPLAKKIKEGQGKLIMQGCDRAQCILPYFNLKGIEEYRGVTRL